MKSCMQTPNLLPGETLDPFILFLVIKISLLRDSLHWSIFWTVYVQHLDCFGRGNYHTARILQSNFVDTYRCIVIVVKQYNGRYHYVLDDVISNSTLFREVTAYFVNLHFSLQFHWNFKKFWKPTCKKGWLYIEFKVNWKIIEINT